MCNLLGLQLAVPEPSHGGPVGGSPCVPSLSPVCLDCATPGCLLAVEQSPVLWALAAVDKGWGRGGWGQCCSLLELSFGVLGGGLSILI